MEKLRNIFRKRFPQKHKFVDVSYGSPSKRLYHYPIPLSPLEITLVKNAIEKYKPELDEIVDDLRVIEREHTVVGNFSRLISLSNKTPPEIKPHSGDGGNFSFDNDPENFHTSVVFFTESGVDLIEIVSMGNTDKDIRFPKEFEDLSFKFYRD